jgi:hypothetical protein
MFFRGSLVRAIGEFDETLGLGTALGCAEDVDYALRAFRAARRSGIMDEVLVGHRNKMTALRSKYYLGTLVVLARYARRDTSRDFLRKIAVGVYLVLRGELEPVTFLDALWRASVELRAQPSSSVRTLPPGKEQETTTGLSHNLKKLD